MVPVFIDWEPNLMFFIVLWAEMLVAAKTRVASKMIVFFIAVDVCVCNLLQIPFTSTLFPYKIYQEYAQKGGNQRTHKHCNLTHIS